MHNLREDAAKIMKACLVASLPDTAVKKAIQQIELREGRLILVAIGKAAWSMAKAASDTLGDRIDQGIVITKYGHVMAEIPKVTCWEAGHPVPDANSYQATQAALEMVSTLDAADQVLFLISGGGSALFESPTIPEAELLDITQQLLACGADIVEINTIRKRLSQVKGGRFAKVCAPARVECIVLSDIIGDPLDMIASGPAYPDSSTRVDALNIVSRYQLNLSEQALACLEVETPKSVDNVSTYVTGSVKELCLAALTKAEELGYHGQVLTDCLSCQAKEAGSFLSSIAKSQASTGPKAFIAGGETVVNLTGQGKGGRNQELALASAEQISGLPNVVIFSLGSDGTDGPTDAAGGIVDGWTKQNLSDLGITIYDVLRENDSYHALEKVQGLIKTGPTGTNVNDVAVVLIG
ncbi:MAG: glycerate kinase [Clostridiaceae bacterium]